ncbi:MAG: MotE family protein [Vulcanimicrobiaceae bacterium]
MIVTRRRRKRLRIGPFVVPTVLLALVIAVLWWPPSHAVIVRGPLKPVATSIGNAFSTVAKPFHFAAQNRVITARNRQVLTLKKQLATAQGQLTKQTSEIAHLQTQLGRASQQRVTTRKAGAMPAPAASSNPFAAGASLTGAGVAPSAAISRIASDWAAMDPSKAAKVIERLPPSYVAQVFAAMSPDAVGPILDALPPKSAAVLTQERAPIKP